MRSREASTSRFTRTIASSSSRRARTSISAFCFRLLATIIPSAASQESWIDDGVREREQEEHRPSLRARGLRREPPSLPDLRLIARQGRADFQLREDNPRCTFREYEHLVALGRRALREAGHGRVSPPPRYRLPCFLPPVPAVHEVFRRALRWPYLPAVHLGLGSPPLPTLLALRLLLRLPDSPGSVR